MATEPQSVIEEVLLEAEAPPGHVEAVREVFDRAGLAVQPRAGLERRSAGLLPWVVYVALTVPIAAFLGQLATRAADDVYPGLKAWAKGIYEARSGAGAGDGTIRIDDSENTTLVLAPEWPDEALDALATVDWSKMKAGYVMWDEQHGWRNALDR